jgi:hypothetical protein
MPPVAHMTLCSNLLVDERFTMMDASNAKKRWNWSSSHNTRYRNPSRSRPCLNNCRRLYLSRSRNLSFSDSPLLRFTMIDESNEKCWNWRSNNSHSLKHHNQSRRSRRPCLNNCRRPYPSSSRNMCFSDSPLLSTRCRILSQETRYVTRAQFLSLTVS